jgi:hypothetical protein
MSMGKNIGTEENPVMLYRMSDVPPKPRKPVGNTQGPTVKNVTSGDNIYPAVLNIENACRYLGDIGRSTIYGMNLPYVSVGHRRMYMVRDLDAFIEANRHE